MQANVSTYIGRDYSPDFALGYDRFEKLYEADPATAAAYMGQLNAPMMNYRRLVKGGTQPAIAFATAFGNPAQYVPTEKASTAAGKAIDTYLGKQDSMTVFGFQPLGRANLNASSKLALKNAMLREIAVLSQGAGSDIPIANHISTAEEKLTRSGAWERYGPLGWSNAPGTEPLARAMNMQPQEADIVVPAVIDRLLKDHGYAEGAYGNAYEIIRARHNGKQFLSVRPVPEDGDHHNPVVIPFDAFIAGGRVYKAETVAPGAKPNRYKNVNAYRRVPGETGAQRISRINREVAAGADPVNHLP